jgi:hypothetical protein
MRVRTILMTAVCLLAWTALAPPAHASATTVGGMDIGYLPAGLGTPSDFQYEFDSVRFASRVWESGDDTNGWHVDLDVVVMRGSRLRTPSALHRWFIAYQRRPVELAHYRRVTVNAATGWACRDQVFWLLRPGLAMSVMVDRTRWNEPTVLRIARSVRRH